MPRSLILAALISLAIPLSAHSQGFFKESGKLALGFYQTVISPVRQPAGSCQFSPSCSQYSKEAIASHGLFAGVVLTADRFMRCSGGHAAHKHYPLQGDKLIDHPSYYPLFDPSGEISLPIKVSNGKVRRASTQALAFSKRLFNEGEFDYSILELKRLEFELLVDPELRSYLPALVAVNQLRKDEVKRGWETLQRIDPTAPLSPELRTNVELLKFVYADHMALYSWNSNTAGAIAHPHSDRFTVYSLARDDEYDRAREMLRSSGIGLRRIEVDATLESLQNSGSRSPLLAGVMSAIIPGAGYMYAGRVEEGVGALITNGLLGWGIYSLFKNGNTGSGILLSSICFPFYLGSIIGSANTAEVMNQKDKALLYEGLRNSLEIDFFFSTDFLDSLW